MQVRIQKFLKGGGGGFQEYKLFIFVKFSWIKLAKVMIKQYYKSIGVKQRKQDVVAFVNTVTQFIHRGSYTHIVTVVRKFS
jgi:hypothetical protein